MTFNGGIALAGDGFLNVTAEWHDSEAIQRNGGNGGLDPALPGRTHHL